MYLILNERMRTGCLCIVSASWSFEKRDKIIITITPERSLSARQTVKAEGKRKKN
jgi:hypothetical protein